MILYLGTYPLPQSGIIIANIYMRFLNKSACIDLKPLHAHKPHVNIHSIHALCAILTKIILFGQYIYAWDEF